VAVYQTRHQKPSSQVDRRGCPADKRSKSPIVANVHDPSFVNRECLSGSMLGISCENDAIAVGVIGRAICGHLRACDGYNEKERYRMERRAGLREGDCHFGFLIESSRYTTHLRVADVGP
jgi:hypothetical protein